MILTHKLSTLRRWQMVGTENDTHLSMLWEMKSGEMGLFFLALFQLSPFPSFTLCEKWYNKPVNRTGGDRFRLVCACVSCVQRLSGGLFKHMAKP